MDVTTVRVFTSDMVLNVNGDYYEVELYGEDKDLKKDRGYIFGEYVFVYRGKLKTDKTESLPCGIYTMNEDDRFMKMPNEKEQRLYHIDNVTEFDLGKIFQDVAEREESFIDPEDIEIINNNTEVWLPTPRDDDDFLKRLVKMAIINKGANLKNYRSKFDNVYALNNMKSGLNKDTKMTVTNFKIWCEVLGLKWRIILEDDGTDRHNPLPEEIELVSEDF